MLFVVALLGMLKLRKRTIRKHARSCFLSLTLQKNETCGCMGKRHIISLKDVKVLDIDFSNLLGIGMPQPLPLAKKNFDNKESSEKNTINPIYF